MYFNNRHAAHANEVVHRKAIAGARSFEEHQMATVMFIQTFVNRYDTDTNGWTQNQLRGYLSPADRLSTTELRGIIDAVGRTLEGCGPQATSSGDALIKIDEELAQDARFAHCPVGSVALFRGVLDTTRWGLTAHKATQLAVPGYFLSPQEFVVVDPVLAGSYLQGITRWHGGMDQVGYLRQQGDPLKLMNRPLSETYALAQTYHEHPDKIATLWLKRGMRFEILPPASSLSRILTPPEDTEPHTTRAHRKEFRSVLEHFMGPTSSAMQLAWAMTDLPREVRHDSDYPGGLDKAYSVLRSVLAHDPSLRLSPSAARTMLAQHNCRYMPSRRLVGSDNVVYNFDPFLSRHSYAFSHVGHYPFGYASVHAHYALLLALLAFIEKYNLPRESLLGLVELVMEDSSPGAPKRTRMLGNYMLKLPALLSADCDAVRSSYVMDLGTELSRLVVDAFTRQRLAVSRATYHSGLNTRQRKKVLAKFFPNV